MSYSLGCLSEQLPKWGPPSTIEAALYRASHRGRSSVTSKLAHEDWVALDIGTSTIASKMPRSMSSTTVLDVSEMTKIVHQGHQDSQRTALAKLTRSISASLGPRLNSKTGAQIHLRHAIRSLPSELRILILECLSTAVPQHICAELASSSSMLYRIFQPALYQSPGLGSASRSTVALRRRLAKEAGLCKALCLGSLSPTCLTKDAVRALRFGQAGLDHDDFDVQALLAALPPSTPRSTLRELEIELDHQCCAQLPHLEQLLMLTPPHGFNLSLLHPSIEAHIPRFGLECSPLAPIPPAVQAAEDAVVTSADRSLIAGPGPSSLAPQNVHVVYCMQCAYLLVRREYPPPPPFWPLALRPPPSFVTNAGLKHLAITFAPTCPDCVADMRREASVLNAARKEPRRGRTALEQEHQICRGMCKEDPAFFAALLTNPTLETISLICRPGSAGAACAAWWLEQWVTLAQETIVARRVQERRNQANLLATAREALELESRATEVRILEMPDQDLDRCSHGCCQAASRPDPQSWSGAPSKASLVPCMYRTIEQLFQRPGDADLGCAEEHEGRKRGTASAFWDWVETLPFVRLQEVDMPSAAEATPSLQEKEELLARCRQTLRRAQELLTVVGPGGPWRS